MIEAIYEFGKRIAGDSPKITLDKVNADYLLILDIDENGQLKGTELRKSVSEIEDKLLHKKITGGKNPPNFTPTLNITELKKSISNINKILKALRKFECSIPTLQEESKIVESVRRELTESGLLGLNQKKLTPKQTVFITLRVNGKFIGDIPEFVKAFESFYLSKLELKKGTCSLCGKTTLVSGKRSPFTFYTLDKIGYLSGFSRKHHLRGFPVCFNCYKILDRAKAELSSHTFKLARGLEYWLIPNVVKAEMDSELLENILDLKYLRSRLKLDYKERQKLADAEEDILEYLKELGDYLAFHFVFITGTMSQEAIRLHIQDVYPSRIKELFEIKSYVENSLNFKNFTFQTIKQFFWKWDKESKDKNLQKYLFGLLDRIFRGIPYSHRLLVKFLLNGIRQVYNEEIEGGTKRISRKSLDAFAAFLFIKVATEGMSMEINSGNLEAFLENLPLLDSPEAKGLFLLGILTQKLLDKQATVRGSSPPFLKKLSGFKLNERGFRKLMPELRDKMEAYGAFGSFERELFDLASKYFAQAKKPWGLSLEEMNFVFAVGMGIKNRIYSKHFNEKEVSHD